MALTAYQTAVQNLIQAPSAPIPLVPVSQLTTYINTARNQVAADAECIRAPVNLAITSGNRGYGFPAMSLPPGEGYLQAIAVRSGYIGTTPLDIRPWEWFAAYYEAVSSSVTGQPTIMAQQGQGVEGTVFFYPYPNANYTAIFDAVVLPIPLVDDTTIEAIPQLWQDAVPFYAAWLAMQSLQRQSDANAMLLRYQYIVRRGRQLATPSELPDNLPGGMGTQRASSVVTLGNQQQQQGQR